MGGTLVVGAWVRGVTITTHFVLGLWAHVPAVTKSPSAVTHTDLLAIQGAAKESSAVPDVSGHSLSFKCRYDGRGVTEPFGCQGLKVTYVNDAGVNGLGVFFQRDALDYSLHRVVGGRLVRTNLVVAVADGDGLKLSLLIGVRGMGCAHDDDVLMVVGAHRVFPCFMCRYVGRAVNRRCEAHGSSGGHVKASSWSYHDLEIAPWE
ncbi:hypothetical protein HPB51_013615 [Rhipicephalus microplus]|uniref:Uncharacterized protein n=1 Tax=Rhipicephalus microplus TaxID=6941 RepID=A0A9J6EGW0_RHIMP|nr:hypothetical protein HPB51_013615 [Rhipicephalus microplus]